METASTLSFSAAAVLCLVPSRIGYDLQYRQLYQVTSENEPTYDLWTIDDPHRAWTNPLSLSLRVKGYNGAPYCILLSSKKIFIVIQLCISIVSSGHNPLEEQTTAAKLFSINETLLFHSPGYGILPSDTVSQNSGRVSVMELHLSVDRSVLPFLGNQYGLADYFVPNPGILQASSYPPPEYYGGGGADPPDRPSGSGKDKGLQSPWQDNEQDYRQGSAGGSSGGNNEDSGPSKRKSSKKTPMACHHCRRRKLKCDGVHPTCRPCADKSLVCTYDVRIKRRGPGKKSLQQESSTGQSDTTTQQPSSSRTAGSFSAPIANLPSPPMPQYPYQLGAPPSGLESRVVSSRLASETRHSGPSTERYAEDYSSRVHTQQPRPSGSAYYPQQQQPSSMSYPGYQESSYRDQYPPYRDPPPYRDQPPLPPLPPPGYRPAEQYYRQDYPSASSSYTAEYSSRRQPYAEEEEEYASEDDNTTSSRREPSPEYEGDIRGRGADTQR